MIDDPRSAIGVTQQQIRDAILAGGLEARPICVHASLRSFGAISGGSATLIRVLLDCGCTLMVPTFSFMYSVMPPEHLRFMRNGANYDDLNWITPDNRSIYSSQSALLDEADMGQLPKAVLRVPGRSRGNHPLCSFAAAGPLARRLIEAQQPMDVYAPLRELANLGGVVVLMGVGLQRMTALHLAEQMAGRRMFVRWANGADGQIVTAECGGDSEGFGALDAAVAPAKREVWCGRSRWALFDARQLQTLAAKAIQMDPSITHCGKVTCLRCNDAVAGGPVVE